MGDIHPFSPEKLIIGVLTTRPQQLDRLEEVLTAEFGPVDYRSELILFNFTDYYTSEMGRDMKRLFFSFDRLVSPDKLAEIKVRTNGIETSFTENGCRKVNLDPGLLSLGKLILASTKDNAQRIPLSLGIFAEITLIYKKKQFRPLPWTYRDYQSAEYQAVLKDIRELYKRQIDQLVE